MVYRLVYHRWYEKSFAKLPRSYQERVDKFLMELRANPTEVKARSKPIKGYPRVYRYRLGKFRLIYALDEDKKEVIALGIESRGRVYKIMQRLLG